VQGLRDHVGGLRALVIVLALVCAGLAGCGGDDSKPAPDSGSGTSADSAADNTPRVPGAPECPTFPADNQWNQPVDDLPVLENSQAMVEAIGADEPLHADFGAATADGGAIGIPFVVVPGSQPKVPIEYTEADESDPGPFPIPPDVQIETGDDHHVIVVDRDGCRLYELYHAEPQDDGARWSAGSGATWDLRSNRLRPEGWTSADAAGLPILPGLARYDEVARGRIDHALRFTVEETREAFIYPARHEASDSTDPNLPAMGERFRLKSSFDTSGLPEQAKVILEGLKRYGMIVADNGSNWFVSGAPDPGWDDEGIRTAFDGVSGSDFEVVDTSGMPRPD
jgi:hypothetical protein